VIDLVYPIGILLAGSPVVYLVGRASRNKALTGTVAVVALLLSGYVMYLLTAIQPQELDITLPGMEYLVGNEIVTRPVEVEEGSQFFAAFAANGLATFMAVTSLGLAALVAIFSIGYMERKNIGKYYALLLLMTAGMVGIGFAGDLFNLFVFFELMSLASFALVAFEDRWEPVEAGVKYLLLSAMGSMVALLGIVLVFAYTGTLNLAQLEGMSIATLLPGHVMLAIAALFIAGFGVKAAIVPMHTWLPDAHSAAPSGISAMLSGMVISAGLVTMIKALVVLPAIEMKLILPALAVVTMLVGNLMAWTQKDLKRMLAYSSIAHMGYILAGVGVAFSAPALAGFEGMRGGLYHILNHAIMKGGAFLCAGAILTVIGTRDLKEMAGIGRKIPLIGICFGIFALALAGAPPLNGFVSKVFICKAGMELGATGFVLIVMVIINSLLSLFYYLPAMNKIIFAPEMSEKVKQGPSQLPACMVLAIFVLALLTIALGIQPQLGLDLVDPAAAFISGLMG
jgi:F420H2 dehydrogenase subunit N